MLVTQTHITSKEKKKSFPISSGDPTAPQSAPGAASEAAECQRAPETSPRTSGQRCSCSEDLQSGHQQNTKTQAYAQQKCQTGMFRTIKLSVTFSERMERLKCGSYM